MSDWKDPLPKVSCADVVEVLTDADVAEAIRTLKLKARYHRQYAAVVEAMIEELEGSIDA